MTDFQSRLRLHVRPFDVLEKECHEMEDMVMNMFDANVQKLLGWSEEDYQGQIMVMYSFESQYFIVETQFNSGYDGWSDCTDDERRQNIDEILSDVTPVDHLWELVPSQYAHPEWKDMVTKLMTESGVLTEFLEYKKYLDRERELQRSYTEGKSCEEAQRQKAEKEKVQASAKQEVLNIVTLLETTHAKDVADLDEKLRRLRWLCGEADLGPVMGDFRKTMQTARFHLGIVEK